jgi:hypothetical protein
MVDGIMERRIGTFKVRCEATGVQMLEAAQRGCAILRCEYLVHLAAFDIYAEHPDFLPVERGDPTPEYDVEMTTDLNGDPIRKCFVLVSANG